MKIGIVTPVFPPYLAGMGNVAYAEALGLKKKGHDVVVVTPDYGNHSDSEVSNLKVNRLIPKFKFGNAAWLNQLPAEFKNLDVVHLHYPFLGGVRVVLKFKKQNPQIPLVVTYHMDLIGKSWKRIFFKIYSILTIPKIFEVADKIIVSSLDYAESGLLKKYLLQNPKKFTEVPFGVEISSGNKLTKEELRKILGIKDDEKIILFVGGLDKAHYFKGLEILLNVFKELVLIDKLLRLLIIGDGDMRGYYQKEVERLGLSNRVLFLGKIKTGQLSNYYAAADLFVLPSLDSSEAYGMVLLEAMVNGTPVIASDLPGVRGLVKMAGGETVKPNNVQDLQQVLKKLLVDDARRKEMGEKAKKWVTENRSVDAEIIQLASVYKNVATV